MTDEPRAYVKIDPELDNYRTLFDHAWSERIMNLAAANPDLDLVVFRLCLDWRAAGNTCLLPWLLTTTVASQLDADRHKETVPEKVLAAIATSICDRMGEKLRNMQRKQLRGIAWRAEHRTDHVPLEACS